MPVKKLCTKTKQVYQEHKKPLLLVLAVAVLTGAAERLGENLFFKKNDTATQNTSNVYITPRPKKNQKITCPYCHREINFNTVTTHTPTSIQPTPQPNQHE